MSTMNPNVTHNVVVKNPVKNPVKVAVIDAGGANLASVCKACERLGAVVTLTRDARVVGEADRVILPGVGHARVAMETLRTTKLDEVVKQLRVPVLGICIGLQQMGDWCEEGNINGLGILKGVPSRKIPNHPNFVVPHMGWNTPIVHQPSDPLLRGLPPSFHVYFVHSYYIDINDLPKAQVVASADHGVRMVALARHRNFWGTQFHPERSGDYGQLILRNFLELTDADLPRD